MKKLLFVFAIFIFFSCDEIPDGVVDLSNPEYQVISITAPDQFLYTETDSVMSVTVELEETSSISKVWIDVAKADGTTKIIRNVELQAVEGGQGELTAYNGDVILGKSVAVGKYVIEVYVQDNIRIEGENIQQVASHNFRFITEQENVPPVIDNLNFVDSVERGVQFIFSVNAEDENGYADIDKVYYEVFDPDGNQLRNSQGITEFPMFDDGETGGDQTAEDGTFTVALTFPTSFETGEYRFEFTAEDNSGEKSNTITHLLELL